MNETQSLPAANLKFVSPQELAEDLHVTIDCIYKLAARRALPVYRVLRRILFRREDVDKWLAENRTDSKTPHVCQ